MLNRLRLFLKPPVFPDDEETSRVARLLNSILLTSVALAVFAILVNFFFPSPLARFPLLVRSAPLAVLMGMYIGLWVAMRRVNVYRVAHITVGVFWLLTTLVVFYFGGVTRPVVYLYTIVTLMAGALLSGRVAAAYTLLSVLTSLLAVVAEASQWISPSQSLPVRGVGAWLILVAILSIVLLLVTLSNRSLKQALTRARRENDQRQRAEAALQRSETIYRQAIMAAGAVPYYRNHRMNTYTFMGEGILSMTGYSASEMTPALWDSLEQEGFPRGALAHLSYAEADRLTEEDSSLLWECDYRIRTRDGQTRWVADTSVKGLDANGERVGVIGILQDITERKQAEEALRAREELYRLISTISADYIFSTQLEADGQLHLKWVGGGFETITGYTFDEYVARGGWLAALHPDDREADARDIAALYANQKVITEVRTFHKNGDVRWVRVYAHPLWDAERSLLTGIYGAVQDITERKQAEERTQSTVKGLRAVVEAADELLRAPELDTFYRRAVELGREKLGLERCGLFLIDETQTYLLGTYGTDAHGQTIDEHGAREPLALRVALFQSDGKPWNVVSGEWGYWEGDQHREFGGGWVVGTAIRSVRGPIGLMYNDAALTGAPVNDVLQETVAVYCSVVGNILERKQAEEAVRQLNTELERRVAERTAQLEAANQELEAFSYSVSHDLRAPLRGIDGFSRILLQDYAPHLDADGQRHLQRVRDGAQRMGQLIDDLLEFSRLSRQPLRKQAVDPAALVRQVLDDLKPDYAHRPVEIVVGDLPACEADPMLLRQVWANLIGNALKYSSQRERARVEVGWRPHPQPLSPGERGVYFVRDNGVGFDMRYAGKLFGVFQRLHSAEAFEGTGVGLANVRRIVERHGGRVWAEAEPDKGATFYFSLV